MKKRNLKNKFIFAMGAAAALVPLAAVSCFKKLTPKEQKKPNIKNVILTVKIMFLMISKVSPSIKIMFIIQKPPLLMIILFLFIMILSNGMMTLCINMRFLKMLFMNMPQKK
ncbi:hypothetical protein [Mycoplasma phocoeninasale]|uniref:hypothetical protein n=1 Tax=Mycoplasma phocoeninasale TaxID=2726117 RepID=UPI0019674A6B|nr:hypothetical protein [Mycoplasma phocoeninasale]MBN0970442.1 hypothetical protein [Mycoplasma phocoeninasale]